MQWLFPELETTKGADLIEKYNEDPLTAKKLLKAAAPTISKTKLIILSTIGNVVQIFDFVLFAAFAEEIGLNFLPGEDGEMLPRMKIAAEDEERDFFNSPWTIPGIILVFTYFVKPAGGIFWGRIGDMKGRIVALQFSILLMSCLSLFMCILPNYSQVGPLSVFFLIGLRVLLAFAVGGETIGSFLFLVEQAPRREKLHYGLYVCLSMYFAYILAHGIEILIRNSCSDQQIQSWAFRIPFFIATCLGFFGYYLRTQLEGDVDPYATTLNSNFLKHNSKYILKTLGILSGWFVMYYFLLWIPTFVSNDELHDLSTIGFMTVHLFLGLLCLGWSNFLPYFPMKIMLYLCGGLFLLGAYPMWSLFMTQTAHGFFVGGIFYIGIMLGLQISTPYLITQLKNKNERYTILGFCYNFAAVNYGLFPLLWNIIVQVSEGLVGITLIFTAIVFIISLYFLNDNGDDREPLLPRERKDSLCQSVISEIVI